VRPADDRRNGKVKNTSDHYPFRRSP
jgi:hypothetical protein